ncbi:hypothetical protein [Streptomyces yangpuensis]|uniref:hypothetical protein n=1 Tax=Streptomyces yangpuensis TaxID=1648182 RepID=UPI003829FB62
MAEPTATGLPPAAPPSMIGTLQRHWRRYWLFVLTTDLAKVLSVLVNIEHAGCGMPSKLVNNRRRNPTRE